MHAVVLGHAYVGQSCAVIFVMLQMECECNDIMSTSYQHEVNGDDIMPMWCSCNVSTNDVMPHHTYVVGLECEPYIMSLWFVSHANPNDIMSGMHESIAHA